MSMQPSSDPAAHPPSDPPVQPPSSWLKLPGWVLSHPWETFKALGILGAIVIAITGFRSANDTARSAQQGLATERFKNGVDELGTKDENVQAGGIYTLVRVAKDSPDDADTAYQVILSFVRGHLCANKLTKKAVASGPPQSVTAGLQVLRDAGRKVDLSHLSCESNPAIDLVGVNLTDAHLEQAHLSGVNFEGATLTGAHLAGAILIETNFTHHTDLTGADLTGADITKAGFENALGLTRDQLRRAHWAKPPPTVDANKKSWIVR
jgi:hypothetical protein